jgi:hypothetical protein
MQHAVLIAASVSPVAKLFAAPESAPRVKPVPHLEPCITQLVGLIVQHSLPEHTAPAHFLVGDAVGVCTVMYAGHVGADPHTAFAVQQLVL